MYDSFLKFLDGHSHFSIIQAENPDGDSLGSAIALDYLISLRNPSTEVSLFCPVDIPKYLRYFSDWSRISNEFDWKAEAYIIVDTAAEILLSKLLEDPAIAQKLSEKPVFVLDHHETEDDLSFPHEKIIEPLPACCDLIFKICEEKSLKLDENVAKNLIYGILSDTLGLTSASTSPETFRHVASLLESSSLNISDLEEARREFMKKSPRILDYKADLIKRVEYFLSGSLATVHIPWEDIREFSDEYNPNVLILEELRLVEGVEVAVAIKTYPDGKLTGKIRSSKPIADKIAGFYGGGGHPYAAGFRTYDISYDNAVRDLIKIVPELLAEAEKTENQLLSKSV
ncbi:DHH family phosphoesterase [Candidatus Saccharibacteria bacterium]|nr:DHH family phosphoesterase [Candidatus Saccharibacteria bacterium]